MIPIKDKYLVFIHEKVEILLVRETHRPRDTGLLSFTPFEDIFRALLFLLLSWECVFLMQSHLAPTPSAGPNVWLLL